MSRWWSRGSLGRAAGTAGELSPGLADAAFSSLAGFAGSLYAARSLDTATLGAYALSLAAISVASLVPQQLLYLPAQVASLSTPQAARPRQLAPVLVPGIVLGMLAGLIAALSGLVLSSQLTTSSLVAIGVGAAMLACLSPAQDHIRSALYLAGQPRRAAAISGLQFAFTMAAMAGMYFGNLADAWIPSMSLAVGTAASAIYGLLASRGERPAEPLRAGTLARSGRSLLPAALIQEASVFLASAVLGTVSSAASLGNSEAARIAARPLQVFSLGVSRVTAPRLMQAGRDRSGQEARAAAVTYGIALMLAGAGYVAIAGWPHPLNPVAQLVPKAYDIEGLAALAMLVAVFGAVAQIPRGVLLGAGKNHELLVISAIAAVARIGVVLVLARALGAYALPVAQLAGAGIAGKMGLSVMRRHLRE